jgi:hypothetical protein
MIQDLDKTLEKIIYERGKLNRNDIDVSFEQPNGDWSSRLARPTVNAWCFDMQENMKLRTMDPRITRRGSIGTTTFPPIRLDFTYLVTAWARKVEDEHQLIWRTLSALAQVPELAPENTEGALKDQPYNIPILVGNNPERMPNLSDLWSVLNNQMRLGFTAVITLSMDRTMVFEAPLAFEAVARVGQSLDPSSRTLTTLDVEIKTSPDEIPDGLTPPSSNGGGSDQERKRKK